MITSRPSRYRVPPTIRRAFLLVCFLGGTPALTQSADPMIQLHDVTDQSGINFVHTDGSRGQYFIVEYVCAGLALFDYDLDGDIDIYFLNGAAPPGAKEQQPSRNALYRNDGNWKFTDVTEPAGVGDTGHGLGVTVGDYDNDGDPDLYLNNSGANVLYRNNGNGTFTDVTREAGVANGNRVGAGTCFLDIDADGDLDLYVANYIRFSYSMIVSRTIQGYPVYPGPRDFAADTHTLYRNNADGTFTDVSQESGVGAHAAPGMGMVCADYDDDGDTDILVGNDASANFLFRNDGTGHFEEVGLLSGFAYDGRGAVQGTMGVECADYDNDGRLDVHVTSYQNERAVLYRNLGQGIFEDVTSSSGVGQGTSNQVKWGNGFVDFDNDGDRDLFIACGHLYDHVDRFDDSTSYLARNLLFANLGDGKFVDITDQAGEGMQVRLSSRGAGFEDMDNDGDIDAVILNSRARPTLLRNDSPAGNHWIQLLLQGSPSNRDGVGARVKVVVGDQMQVAEIHSGRAYQGHYGTRLHFGLGSSRQIDRIHIRWCGGKTQILENITADRILRIRER